jgi:hypothetical protein
MLPTPYSKIFFEGGFCATIKGMLKLNYHSKVATSRNVGKKRLGERLRLKQNTLGSFFG